MTAVLRHKFGLLALTMAAMFALLLMPKMVHGEEEYWLSAITKQVVGFHEQWGNLQPYLDQLQVIRSALREGDQPAAYAAMNRFMDMLERRESGIAPPIADWLFGYCNTVAPTKYHDISRHIRKIG